MSPSPIRHDEAFELPVLLEDIGEEIVILAGVVAVEAVVRAHDGRHVGLPYADLESEKVTLAHCSLVDVHVYGVTSTFLVVQGIVLDVADDVLVLRALDDLSNDFASQDRVLAHVLERTAIAGFAGDVHASPQRHVVTLRAQLAADQRSILMRSIQIPAGRASHARGERRRITSVLSTHSDAVGGVGHLNRGNPQTRNRYDVTSAAVGMYSQWAHRT